MNQPLLGNRVATLRIKKGLTQKDLAIACNVDIRTIQRIEAGEVLPRMYTIRLLARALGTDVGSFLNQEKVEVKVNKQLKWSVIAGIIFSLNYIPIVLQITKRPFNFYTYSYFIWVDIFTCIFFFRGFYMLGKQSNNQLMAIPAFLSMILLPLLNIMSLLNETRYGISDIPTIMTITCINAIIYGMGLLNEAKRKIQKNNLYKIAGITTLVQSGLFLSLNYRLMIAGLIISLFCNFIMAAILFQENRQPAKETDEPTVNAVLG